MRITLLSIALLVPLAVPASAQDGLIPFKYVAAPQGFSMVHQATAWAEKQKPEWAGEQKGYVGKQFESIDAVAGIKLDGHPMAGFSLRY